MITHYYSLLEHQPETPSIAVNYKTISKLLSFMTLKIPLMDVHYMVLLELIISQCVCEYACMPRGQESAIFLRKCCNEKQWQSYEMGQMSKG